MKIRQYTFTLALITHEPADLPEFAVAQAMISDADNGGTALPVSGASSVRVMAIILGSMLEKSRQGKLVFVKGVNDGRDVATLRPQEVAEAMVAAGESEAGTVIVPPGVFPLGGKCDVCGVPVGELHDPNCPRVVAQGERVFS